MVSTFNTPMVEEEFKKLADTLLKSGLATNQTEAMEKARSSFGAEQILKKLQQAGKEPLLKETKTVSPAYNVLYPKFVIITVTVSAESNLQPCGARIALTPASNGLGCKMYMA